MFILFKLAFRTLKRELENSAKNCRVLQFKLKKTEKSLNDTQSDLGEAESKLKSLSGGSNALDSINKVGKESARSRSLNNVLVTESCFFITCFAS